VVIRLFEIVVQVREFTLSITYEASDVLMQMITYRMKWFTGSDNDALIEYHARRCLCYFATTIVCIVEGRRCLDLDDQVCELTMHWQDVSY
jgi:hypothetical protein